MNPSTLPIVTDEVPPSHVSAAASPNLHMNTNALEENYRLAIEEKEVSSNNPGADGVTTAPTLMLSTGKSVGVPVLRQLTAHSLPHDMRVKKKLPVYVPNANERASGPGECSILPPAKPVADLLAIQTPLQVRFPMSLLPLFTIEASQGMLQWTTGVAVHSYVRSEKRELTYVILLDSGENVHLPSGQVERLNIFPLSNSDDNSRDAEVHVDFKVLGGHPSSQDLGDESQTSFGSFYSALFRSSIGGSSSLPEVPSSLVQLHATADERNKLVAVPEHPFVAVESRRHHGESSHCRCRSRASDNVEGEEEPPLKTTSTVGNKETAGAPKRSSDAAPTAFRKRLRPSTSYEASNSQQRQRLYTAGIGSLNDGDTEAPAAVPRRDSRRTMSAVAQRQAFLNNFSEESWRAPDSTFRIQPQPFSGPTPGPSFSIHRMPTAASLFGRLWTESTLQRICMDTNRYASKVNVETQLPLGGPSWWPLDKLELRAFFAVNILMGIKRLPNHRSYWNKQNEFLYCPNISTIMTCKRYEDITRCLHVEDDTVPASVGEEAQFDKLRKLRWLLTEIQLHFKSNWHLHQEVTVDKSMVAYKGKYCPIRQYLPRKPVKWGVKLWCLDDARAKYLYEFQVYTSSLFRERLVGGGAGDAQNSHDVIMQLMAGLHGVSRLLCTDNYFSSVKLFLELRALGTLAVGTVRCNRQGLPPSLQDLRTLSKQPQGSTF